MKQVTIPAGTVLYRAADDIISTRPLSERKKVCTDTGKNGIYFSTYILQSVAMVIERKRNLQLGIFRTTTPITVYYGKYSFRKIHPERYFDKDGRFICNVVPLNDEIISHIDHMWPIIDTIEWTINPTEETTLLENDNNGEVFVTDNEYLDHIKLIDVYFMDYDKLQTCLEHIQKEYGYLPLFEERLYLCNSCSTRHE